MDARPRLLGVLETVLYYRSGQEDEVGRFYAEVLGLRPIGRGRWSFSFRAGGSGVLLLFDAERSSAQDEPPPHGASGQVHTCFLAPAEDYERWKEHLASHDVPVIGEISWDSGLRSIYFHDPAGNLLEIAEGDLWPE